MEDKNFPKEDWWVEWQLELVEDRSRNWTLTDFKPVAGFWIRMNGQSVLSKISEHGKIPEDAEVEEGAWDHEHCELCGTTISTYESDQKDGYTDGKEWVCKECYENYIAPRLNL